MKGISDRMNKGIVGFIKSLKKWTERPSFSYVTLLLLDLKVMWKVWEYRDLTVGDTAAYFSTAYFWFKNLSVDIVWSPLYTAYYGSLLFFSSDIYLVTILHRLIIVLALAMMVLALMRRFLPPGMAWLISAWWVIIPFNFDVFEVHLFAFLPILGAWLLILSKDSPWRRGGAIAILLASSILIRNELIVATGALIVICLWWEIRLVRRGRSYSGLSIYLGSYGLPLLIAGLISFFFYTQSVIQFRDLSTAFKPKHTVNMCQAYAYGYKQRHPEWNKDHWTECQDLMMAHFGKHFPTLLEMVQRNPRATIDHVLWNISLLPNGIQASLFGAISGEVSPDYSPVPSHSRTVFLLSMMVVGIFILGGFFLLIERERWWKEWLQDRALGLLVMLATLTVVFLVVIPTQRPRPEYLYSLTLTIMALTGICVFVILGHWKIYQRLDQWVLVIGVVLVLLVTPQYYDTPHYYEHPRTLLNLYRRLSPFQEIIASPRTVFLKGEEAFNIWGYLGLLKSKVLDYRILDKLSGDMPLDIFLEKRGINLFYVDESLNARLIINPLHHSFLISPESFGWKVIALEDSEKAKWKLLQKKR